MKDFCVDYGRAVTPEVGSFNIFNFILRSQDVWEVTRKLRDLTTQETQPIFDCDIDCVYKLSAEEVLRRIRENNDTIK